MTRLVALDLETYRIEPGVLTPRIVCGSVSGYKTSSCNLAGGHLLTRQEVVVWARDLLANTNITTVGASIAFDFGCLAAEDPTLISAIFAAYAAGRVHDVLIAQALDAISLGLLFVDPATGERMRGRYSLDKCVSFVLGRNDAKARDAWRERYALLDGVPHEDWPEDARRYPVDDAINTLEVARAQVSGGGVGPTPGPHANLGDLAAQAESAWGMHLGAAWGARTDREAIGRLRERAIAEHEIYAERFRKLGFIREDGREDQAAVRRAVVRAYGGGDLCPNPNCVGGKTLSARTGRPVNCPDCSGTGLDVSPAPRTEKGVVRADRDALSESGDPDLAAYGDNEAEKLLETYLPFVESGVDRPVTIRPNVLVASGRASYDGLIQLLPRDGGVRECLRARGAWCGSPIEYVYCSVDYSALELCTLAQICLDILGRSQMAETINAYGDPGMLHSAFGAQLAGWTTEEMTAALKSVDSEVKERAKRFRQAAKAGNFGFPGGMGAAKLVLAKRKKGEGETVAPDGTRYVGIRFCVLLGGAERCGVEKVVEWKSRPTPPLCRACVQLVEDWIRPEWFRQWPEMSAYFNWVNGKVERGEAFPCLRTSRVRGGCDFTNGANNGFQALASDGAKHALRLLTRECYLDRLSPLWGSRPIFFLHDEILAELLLDQSSEAGDRMAKIMVDAMQEYVPDVCVRADPTLMRRWYKQAEMARDERGRLMIWEPK